MTKNEKGLTLLVLTVTIIVILILAGVVMSINMSLNKSVELKEVVSNMEIIKTATTPYRDRYIGDTIKNIDEDKSVTYTISDKFLGEHMDPKNSMIIDLLNYSNKTAIGEEVQYWFKLNQKAMDQLNINIKVEDDCYFINYQTLEVAYCKEKQDEYGRYIGIKARKRFGGETGAIRERYVYFYKDLRDVKTREVRK